MKDGGQSIGIEASSNGDLRAAIRRQRTRVKNADRRAEDLAKASESGLLTEDLLETTRLLAQENPRRRTIVRYDALDTHGDRIKHNANISINSIWWYSCALSPGNSQ